MRRKPGNWRAAPSQERDLGRCDVQSGCGSAGISEGKHGAERHCVPFLNGGPELRTRAPWSQLDYSGSDLTLVKNFRYLRSCTSSENRLTGSSLPVQLFRRWEQAKFLASQQHKGASAESAQKRTADEESRDPSVTPAVAVQGLRAVKT